MSLTEDLVFSGRFKTKPPTQEELDKQHAAEEVRRVALRVADRLTQHGDWSGLQRTVCSYLGPHADALCGSHRIRLRMAFIPGARSQIRDKFSRADGHLLLGSDGWIYRTGRTKIYRAHLTERATPGDIYSLIPKLRKLM